MVRKRKVFNLEMLRFRKIFCRRPYTVPSARPYTEGEVIGLMRERGIGRPGTYAKIISTLFERGYIVEEDGSTYLKRPQGRWRPEWE